MLRGGPVQLGCARAISHNAPAVEISCGQITQPQWVASFGGERQPLHGKRGIAVDPQSFREAGADIVLGARHAGAGDRLPKGERGDVVASLSRRPIRFHSPDDFANKRRTRAFFARLWTRWDFRPTMRRALHQFGRIAPISSCNPVLPAGRCSAAALCYQLRESLDPSVKTKSVEARACATRRYCFVGAGLPVR